MLIGVVGMATPGQVRTNDQSVLYPQRDEVRGAGVETVEVPDGFRDETAISGLTEPTVAAFAPDHPYPSHLELTLTARDSDGNVGTRTIELHAAARIEIPPYVLKFDRWEDGAGASRIIDAPEEPTTYTIE